MSELLEQYRKTGKAFCPVCNTPMPFVGTDYVTVTRAEYDAWRELLHDLTSRHEEVPAQFQVTPEGTP